MNDTGLWYPSYPRLIPIRKLRFTRHAQERMRQRRIDKWDVLVALQFADWEYAPERAIRYACDSQSIPFRRRFAARHAGLHDLVVIMSRDTCKVITVYRLSAPDREWRSIARSEAQQFGRKNGRREN